MEPQMHADREFRIQELIPRRCVLRVYVLTLISSAAFAVSFTHRENDDGEQDPT
jgi:hypothetical protein